MPIGYIYLLSILIMKGLRDEHKSILALLASWRFHAYTRSYLSLLAFLALLALLASWWFNSNARSFRFHAVFSQYHPCRVALYTSCGHCGAVQRWAGTYNMRRFGAVARRRWQSNRRGGAASNRATYRHGIHPRTRLRDM